MKGIILAGGLGTRLYPLTKSISKQILPIYDKPMIYYPLSVLMQSGIREILIISSKRDIICYKELLSDGSQLGLHISYKVQMKPKGIADAFIIGKNFINKSPVTLILGDNVFYGEQFENTLQRLAQKNKGATIFGYYHENPGDFGVVEFDEKGNVISIEEKPKKPKSNYVIPGLYFYDNEVVGIARNLKPSDRGELEITDVNKVYMKENKLKVEILEDNIKWLDTGTYDTLLEAGNFVANMQKIENKYIGCIEEIAFLKGYITENQILELAKSMKRTQYGQYLYSIVER